MADDTPKPDPSRPTVRVGPLWDRLHLDTAAPEIARDLARQTAHTPEGDTQ